MLLTLILYILLSGLLLGLGTGIGFLLRWILPEVGLGIAILIGVVTTSAAIVFLTWINLRMAEEDEEDEEDEDWADEIRPQIFVAPGMLTRRKRKNRKRSR
jgi:hypothetical protein